MSIEGRSSSNVAPAYGSAVLAEVESRIFDAAVRRALESPEITSTVDGPRSKKLDLRNYLYEIREYLIVGAAAEKQRWLQAVETTGGVRDLISGREEGQAAGLEFLALLSFLLLIAAGIAALGGLIGGYILAVVHHSLTSWRHVGWVGTVMSIPLLVVWLISNRLNDRRVLQRQSDKAEEAAARSEYETGLADLALGELRNRINQAYRSYDCWLRITKAPGLAEIYSDEYRVDSAAAQHLKDMLDQMPGGTIGLAGPRGAGKTTLIRMHCPEGISRKRSRDITICVSAPVEYAPQEFILHLLATLCRAYLQHWDAAEEESPVPIPRVPAVGRLRNVNLSVSVADRVVERVSSYSAARITLAQQYLKQLRYLQSYTTTLGASVSLPAGLAGSSGQAAAAAAELSPPYPELVSDFCKFLRAVAQEVRESGGHVIIGVDELDKISDGEQAQRFINELKAVLGVPNCYYLIAVSENALAAYDLRGLPIRDAFDSAFDEVIPLGYQSLDGSRDLLAKRVIGMSEPFVCLCHCLAAGLPRDLIRSARHAVAASRRSGPRPDHLSTICERLVADELSRNLHATGIKWARSQPRKPESDILYSIQQITKRQNAPGALPKDLHNLLNNLAMTVRHIKDRDDISQISELAGYLYYLETLLEIFTHELTREQIIAVDTGHREDAGAFDQLCFAKQTLAIDCRRSWLTVDAFRRAWNLAIIPYPNADADGSILLRLLLPPLGRFCGLQTSARDGETAN